MKLFDRGEMRAVWGALKVDVFTTRLFVDPVAVPLVVIFSKIKWMSPNKVSILALVSGAIASVMFYKGWFMYGALWYYIFFLFDCIDGKLARFTSMFDRLGGFYDFAIDRFVISAMTFGFVVALTRQELFASATVAGAYVLIFLLKDVLSLKWRECVESSLRNSEVTNSSGAVSRFCNRYKIHFKPGQILSCFVVFIVGPLTGEYQVCSLAGGVLVLFSIGANIVVPYVQYLWQPRERKINANVGKRKVIENDDQ